MSCKKFNTILHDMGIIFYVRGAWVLYAGYHRKGYTQTRTHKFGRNGSRMQLMWTQKGRQWLFNKLADENIYPIKKRTRKNKK